MLELEDVEVEEKFGVKKTALGSFIKAAGIKRLLLSLKACLFLRNLSRRTVGLPTSVSIVDPLIRGHDLFLDKTCQWQPRLETWSGRRKNGSK